MLNISVGTCVPNYHLLWLHDLEHHILPGICQRHPSANKRIPSQEQVLYVGFDHRHVHHFDLLVAYLLDGLGVVGTFLYGNAWSKDVGAVAWAVDYAWHLLHSSIWDVDREEVETRPAFR